MSLDVFDTAIRNADSEVVGNAARDLPSRFAENFDVSLRQSTEWNNSNNFAFARERALATFYDEVKATTGESLPLYGLGGAVTLDELNAKLTSIPGRDPESGYQPLTEKSIDAMALRRMARAHGDNEAMGLRERTWAGTAGMLAGGLIGALSDPVTQATLPLGGAGELGVALRALEFAGIAAGTQAGTAALSYSTREAAVPGSSKEIPGEIASAALFGAGLGGFFGLLGKFLGAGSRPLPTALREDVNAAASEAQINAANVFPGASGEAANRDAVTSAVQSAVRGERVTAGEAFEPVHVQGFAENAGARDTAAIAEAGDRAQRPITGDVVPDVERFERVPNAGEDAASYWERRAAEASPEERAALGIMDDTPPVRDELRSLGVHAPDLAPEQLAALAADPQTDSAVLRNLDRLRVENIERDFTEMVRQPDGSTQLVTRKLEDVMDEIDGFEKAGRELLACATGLMAAE